MIRKSIFSVVAALSFVSVASAAASYEVKGGKTHNYYIDASGSTDCSIYLRNTGAAGMVVQYEQIELDFPSTWSMSGFCDNRGCYFDWPMRDSFLPMANNEEGSFKITVAPNGKSDTAVIKYAIWDGANPAQRDTLVFNIFVRWGASTGTLRVTDFSIGPNPADDYVDLRADGASNISVFNMRGELVLTRRPDAVVSRISLQGLAAGQYLIVASNEKQYWSRRFLINR